MLYFPDLSHFLRKLIGKTAFLKARYPIYLVYNFDSKRWNLRQLF